MGRIRSFILKNIYSIFFATLTLLAIGIFFIVKGKVNKLVEGLPNRVNEGKMILNIVGAFLLIVLILIALFIYLIRSEVIGFSRKITKIIDKLIYKEEIIFDTNKETLLSKIENKFKHFVEIMENDKKRSNNEKNSIKALISDISHQIKTPISNIAIYNDTLIEHKLEEGKQKEFLNNMKFQVSKLEWLVQALIKMSRLENNIISLNISEGYISETIADALSAVYLKAEDKNINLTIDCPNNICLSHDKKWTSEAIFNILENAVKYTNLGGEISLKVDKWDLFTKIDIKDTGIGINKEEINNIFKRFYRSSSVSEIEGVGIGLYLANEIITKQGGYIKVVSKKNEGSTFSVFLYNG